MNELALELDGNDVHADTADAPRVLDLAAAYFDLIERLAEARHSPTRFVGLRVIEKCLRVASDVTITRDALLALAAESQTFIAGDKRVPKGFQTVVGRVRDCIERLPRGVHAKVFVGEWSGDLALGEEGRRDPRFHTQLRAVVMRVGGDNPTVMVRLVHERQTVTLRVGNVDRALALGKLLYREVDLEVRLSRDPAGRIEEGDIVAVHEVAGDASTVWRKWLGEHAAWLADADDIEGELDGDR